jgi:hypothetical protein
MLARTAAAGCSHFGIKIWNLHFFFIIFSEKLQKYFTKPTFKGGIFTRTLLAPSKSCCGIYW